MFEEIRLEDESVHPTKHPHIVITQAAQPETGRIASWLVRAATSSDARAMLTNLLPDYSAPSIADSERPAGNELTVRDSFVLNPAAS